MKVFSGILKVNFKTFKTHMRNAYYEYFKDFFFLTGLAFKIEYCFYTIF